MKVTRKRAYILKSILNDVEVDSMPGLVRAIGRMIGQNQPSIECVREFDNDLSSASDSDQVWDAALDFAKCLRDAKLDPEPPEPPPPPPDPPHPDPLPPGGGTFSVADIVLAAFLVQLQKRSGAE
jgi:hypothetical protein